MNYERAVEWYYAFARFDAHAPAPPDAHKLLRMRGILARLGNPQERFPSVLIAGTKGKGSTAALLESILRAAGYRTGLFTSPHLHSFRERIRIGGEMIPAKDVVEGTRQLQEIARDLPGSTFFEWVTALAFWQMARADVELAVVEVGLGGRLDCTNVLTPRVSVITPVSYDHMEILGNTLAEIAGEKAGIIKPGVPVVVAPQAEEAWAAIARTAELQGARVVDVSDGWHAEQVAVSPERQRVRVHRPGRARGKTYSLPLLGPHQRVNLLTALAVTATLEEQGWRVADAAARRGVAGVKWPGRFEVLAREPFVVADGAHNRASAHELVRTLDEVWPGQRVHFVFGASNDKDIAGMLGEIVPRAASLTLTRSGHARAAEPAALAARVSPGGPVSTRETVADALARARELAGRDDIICVTGSLFIAAEARALLLGLGAGAML